MATNRTATKPAKPKYQVVDDVFVAQTPEGEIKIRLSFKTKLLRAIRDKGDELDQLIALLDGIGDQKSIAQIDELDFLEETMPLVDAFFTAFAEKQQASLGESSGSSGS